MSNLKRIGKQILAGAGVFLLLVAAAGCNEVEKFSWEKLKATHYRMITGKAFDGSKQEAGGQAASSDKTAQGQKAGQAKAGTKVKNPSGKVNVVLYFADKNGDYLKAENRTLQMVPGLAKATVNELIKGPKGEGLSATMPKGTKINEIDIRNGLCRIDLSKEFRDNHWGGSSGEILTVYSLVDTLTQFDTVEKVEILIDGQSVETLKGHMDLTAPVFRNNQIIKEVP